MSSATRGTVSRVIFAGAFGSLSMVLVACGDDGGSAPPLDEGATLAGDSPTSPPTASPVPSVATPNLVPADPKLEAERLKSFLDARYTPRDVRHSFHTKFGETIDCIDYFAQEGVKELAAQGTPITELPAPADQGDVPEDLRDVLFTGTHDDEGRSRACPPDSVPTLRITSERIQAAGGLDAFIDAHHKARARIPVPVDVAPPEPGLAHYAHTYQDYAGASALLGGTARMSVQKPIVIRPEDHSIVQTWLTSGLDSRFQTVEAGAIVSFLLNGDYNPHFFIFATNNNYANGCYNNVSGKPGSCLSWIGAPGATLAPGMTLSSSVFNGTQQEVVVTTRIGTFYGTAGWNVMGAGVYPSSAFVGTMKNSAQDYSVGGEVYDVTDSWYVPMGSGAEPMAAYGQAGYWQQPGSGGLGVMLPSYTWDYSSFGNPWSTVPSAYGTHWWGSNIYFGPQENSFYSTNYGYGWSRVGDWAYGSYKAQCDYTHGIPLKGVAARTDGTGTNSILCGDYPQTGQANACYARSFANADNRGSLDGGWDWDFGYVKGECGYQEVVSGIAQSGSHKLNTILCCPSVWMTDHNACTVEKFASSNSPSYGAGPDWAVGLYKGVCPVGKAVIGISRKSSGAARALLCCNAT